MTGNGPRKVLHVLNGPGGGAALSTIALMRWLGEIGIRNCAVCHAAGTESEREHLRVATHGEVLFTPLYWWNRKIRSRAWKRPLIEVRQLLNTGAKRFSTAQVVRFASQHGADLIHSNTILTLEGALAAQRLALPHVWHVRELVGAGHPFRLPLEKARLGQFLTHNCDCLVANSHVTASLLAPWVPSGLLEVVPNGIDIARFRTHQTAAVGSPIVVAMVASLTSRTKNHLLFVQAAGLVDRSLPIEWRIYGHDPSHNASVTGDEYLNLIHSEIRRCNLADRFRLAGFCGDPAEIMAEIDVLVHPAENESFGRVVVEAMAASLPVVGIDAGGVGEIVRHDETGLLCEPNQPVQMAMYIERLARQPDLRRTLGCAGRARAIKYYSLDACAENIAEVYRRVWRARMREDAAQPEGRLNVAPVGASPAQPPLQFVTGSAHHRSCESVATSSREGSSGPGKVLHVLNGAGGGASLSTMALMKYLRAAGIESCAVCHDAGTSIEREQLRDATEGNLLFTPLYWWNRKIRSSAWKRPFVEVQQLIATGCKWRSTAIVARFAREHGVDLVHTNTILTLEGALASRKLRLPHVWHVRELIGEGYPFRLPLEGIALGAFLGRNCERLVANSRFTAEVIRQWLSPGLLEVVPNGIEISYFAPRRCDLVRRPLVVAMVGSLTSRWKNHMLFVAAASRVDRSLPVQWRIYGHDPSNDAQIIGDEYVDALNSEVRRCGLADRFHLMGFRADPTEIMAEIDILVHPTAGESFGRVVVEAMAAALPVVGVRAGGVGELVKDGETGLLADVDQADQLASHIEQLLLNADLRNKLGRAGRTRAELYYSIDACVGRIAEIYKELYQQHAAVMKT